MHRFFFILFLLLTATNVAAQQRERHGLGRLIQRAVTVDTTRRNAQVIDEEQQLRRYDGKRIGTITFERSDIFSHSRSFFQKAANGIHTRTRERVVRQDLLLREGDIFDAAKAVKANRLLLSRPYISRSGIIATTDPNDPDVVNLRVTTVDSWTIGLDGGKWRESRAMVEVYDENFLGMGTKVGVKSHFNYKHWKPGGEVVELETHNFLGSFFHSHIVAGHDFDSRRFEASFSRQFILLSDYDLGAEYSNINSHRETGFLADRSVEYWRRESQMHLWGGKSWKVGDRTGLYVTGHASRRDYPVRPADTSAGINPALHDRTEALLSTGLYREHFYSATMIYGYGFNEYIATGSKFELVGGASWQEYGRFWYGGANLHKGGFFKWGYLAGGIDAGSYWEMTTGRDMRSVLNAELFWFSNLWGKGPNKARQFITLNYTHGWNMGEGMGAVVSFSDRGMRPSSFRGYGAGRTRLLANTETVLFTRHRPWGFRMAIFGFADAGTIGMNDNPLRNEFFGSAGIGVRFKNERLIFNAIQVRLGVSFGRSGFEKSSIFRLSSEHRMTDRRFLPSRVEVVSFE